MGTRTTICIDDIEGTEENVRTAAFGYDGVSHTIHLVLTNNKKLGSAKAEFIGAAKRTGSSGTRYRRPFTVRRSLTGSRKTELASKRPWALGTVSDRGRIRVEIQDAYYVPN